MIGRLTGILVEKNPPQILLDVQGVAYEVDVPMSTFYNLPATGERIVLFTHLVVREDAHLLFGFGTEHERRAFRQLREDQRRRRADGAVGAVRTVGGRARAGGDDAGRRTAHENSGHRQEDRRAPAARVEGQARRRRHCRGGHPPGAACIGRRPQRAPGARLQRSSEAVAAVKKLPEGASVGDGIRQALKLLAKV